MHHAHTPLRRDKSFWLVAVLPVLFLAVLVYQKVPLDSSLITAISMLPAAFLAASKGKQAYLLKASPEGDGNKPDGGAPQAATVTPVKK